MTASPPDFAFVIVAAGSGTRLGSDLPKALVPLQGKPLFSRVLETAGALPSLKEIVVVVPKNQTPDFQPHIPPLNINITLVEGGNSRTESVIRGLRACPPDLPVLVHDAARCLCSPALIASVALALGNEKNLCIVPVLPIQDAVKQVEGATVKAAPSRENLFATQTPQGLSPDLAAQMAALEGGDFHDEAVWAMSRGARVLSVPGERRNLKITWPEDMELAAFYLSKVGP